ncbi:hypothetical protein V7114_20680 [Neobacillus niacini]|uniref:hypothetical protein n=1 Tax=Neobacillus niacini TaxID=86668 RepID=UPI003000E8C4
MKAYDFTYKEKGIEFRAVYLINRYKVYGKLGNKTVIEHGKTVEEAQAKAVKRLNAPTQIV